MAQPGLDDESVSPARSKVSSIRPHPADPVRSFRVDIDGYVQADDATARDVAGTVSYIARLAEAVGGVLGAGDLRAVEVTGPVTVYAALQRRVYGQLEVLGLLDPLASAPESLLGRLRGSPS